MRRELIVATLAGLIATIHWPDAPELASTSAPDSIARFVHLDDAGELVREITRHPHWQLQFGDAWFECTARGFSDVYTFGDGENITWDAPDMPRRVLALTDAERVELHALPAMSSHEPYPDGDYDRDEQHFVVSFGDLKAGQVFDQSIYGPRIGAYSPMGHVISTIVTAARERYVAERMRFVGDVRLTMEGLAEPYDRETLTLAGRAYEVRSRGRVIDSDVLSEEDFVDLADWALAQPPAGAPPEGDPTVRVSIRVGDHTMRAAYAWSYPRALDRLIRSMER